MRSMPLRTGGILRLHRLLCPSLQRSQSIPKGGTDGYLSDFLVLTTFPGSIFWSPVILTGTDGKSQLVCSPTCRKTPHFHFILPVLAYFLLGRHQSKAQVLLRLEPPEALVALLTPSQSYNTRAV